MGRINVTSSIFAEPSGSNWKLPRCERLHVERSKQQWGSGKHAHHTTATQTLKHRKRGPALFIWINGLPRHTTTALAYLLGLLAMIKCSICSYQCDN